MSVQDWGTSGSDHPQRRKREKKQLTRPSEAKNEGITAWDSNKSKRVDSCDTSEPLIESEYSLLDFANEYKDLDEDELDELNNMHETAIEMSEEEHKRDIYEFDG